MDVFYANLRSYVDSPSQLGRCMLDRVRYKNFVEIGILITFSKALGNSEKSYLSG